MPRLEGIETILLPLLLHYQIELEHMPRLEGIETWLLVGLTLIIYVGTHAPIRGD